MLVLSALFSVQTQNSPTLTTVKKMHSIRDKTNTTSNNVLVLFVYIVAEKSVLKKEHDFWINE